MDRHSWVEIDLDNLAHNVRYIRERVGENVDLMAVVKADAYGNGSDKISGALFDEGIRNFAVATYKEALEIRHKYKDVTVLILGYTPVEAISGVVENDIDQMVQSYGYAEKLNVTAKSFGKRARVHINFDTGMTRYGFTTEVSELKEAKKVFDLEHIDVNGIMTHFTSSDMLDVGVSVRQVARFERALDYLRDSGIDLPKVHVSNSGGIIRFGNYRYDMVRMGLIMYGVRPSRIKAFDDVDLKPVTSLKVRISRVKKCPEGTAVGYAGAYVLPEDETIVTLPIGYADGITRLIDRSYRVLFKGERHRIAGNVCMDAMMVVLNPGISAQIGDVVTFFGRDEDEEVLIEELSDAMGLIPYELLSRLSLRLERVYIKR